MKMIKHLQYHLEDGFTSFIDDTENNIHIDKDDYNLKAGTQSIPTVFDKASSKYSKLSYQINNMCYPTKSPIDGYLEFNTDLEKLYPNYEKNMESIKDDTDAAIKNFINKGGRIRDLLFRMNSIDPVEREFMNRGNTITAFNENFNNFNMSYRSSCRDDMVTSGLMGHEVEAILLYLLNGSNIRIIEIIFFI